MLRCLAIDDEPLALELLEDNISKVPYMQLVAKCSNPIEAMKVLQEQAVDLIFLIYRCRGLPVYNFYKALRKSQWQYW